MLLVLRECELRRIEVREGESIVVPEGDFAEDDDAAARNDDERDRDGDESKGRSEEDEGGRCEEGEFEEEGMPEVLNLNPLLPLSVLDSDGLPAADPFEVMEGDGDEGEKGELAEVEERESRLRWRGVPVVVREVGVDGSASIMVAR